MEADMVKKKYEVILEMLKKVPTLKMFFQK